MIRLNKQLVPERRDQFLSSWKEYAAEVSFAGEGLDAFETATANLLEVRKEIEAARTKLAGLLLARDQADQEAADRMVRIAHAIRGDTAYGEDCPFYRSLGFIPKSQRRNARRVKSTATSSATSTASGEESGAEPGEEEAGAGVN